MEVYLSLIFKAHEIPMNSLLLQLPHHDFFAAKNTIELMGLIVNEGHFVGPLYEIIRLMTTKK